MSDTARPQPKKAVRDLLTYRPSFGKADQQRLIRLSANEGALGASPLVNAFMNSSDIELHRYPEIQDAELHQAIASRYGLNAENILTSNGSDELIALLAMAYLEPGDEVVHSQYAFLVIPQAVRIAGGVPVAADDDGLTVSIDNMLAAVTARTKIVFLVNPNNPTGTIISMDEVRRLHSSLPEDVLLVLDWAYAEYLEDSFSDAATQMVENFQNVVVTRTFSKLHGLASLRLGWAYCPDHVVTALGSIRGPFSVNAVAAQAGTLAIKDTAFQHRSIEHNSRWIKLISNYLNQQGFRVMPSVTNFILIHFDPLTGPSAEQAAAFMAERGVLLRTMQPYGLGDYLRMSMGTDEEMAVVKDCFAELRKQFPVQ